MRFRSFTLGIIMFLASGLYVRAQVLKNLYETMDVFAGIGATSYYGDIGGKDSRITGVRAMFDNLDIDLWQVRAMGTAGLRIHPFSILAFDLEFSPTYLSSSDQRSNFAWRGSEFKTWVLEGSFKSNIFLSNPDQGMTIFGIIGVSAMSYSYTFKDSLSQVTSEKDQGKSLIIGCGTQLPSRTRLIHTFEASYHYTNVDNLDGFRTSRGSHDLFFTLTYKLHMRTVKNKYYNYKGRVRSIFKTPL